MNARIMGKALALTGIVASSVPCGCVSGTAREETEALYLSKSDVSNALAESGIGGIRSVDWVVYAHAQVSLGDGSMVLLAWNRERRGDEPGALAHQCRRLKQAMDAGVVAAPVTWKALEYGAQSRIFAEPWEMLPDDIRTSLRRGDEEMADHGELNAIAFYNEAAAKVSALGRIKERIARRALSDVCREIQRRGK